MLQGAHLACNACKQAYGAKNYKMVGVILQRALLICGLTLVLFLPLWFNMEPVFVAIGMPLPITPFYLKGFGAMGFLLSLPVTTVIRALLNWVVRRMR